MSEEQDQMLRSQKTLTRSLNSKITVLVESKDSWENPNPKLSKEEERYGFENFQMEVTLRYALYSFISLSFPKSNINSLESFFENSVSRFIKIKIPSKNLIYIFATWSHIYFVRGTFTFGQLAL